MPILVPRRKKFLLCSTETEAMEISAKALRARYPGLTDEQYSKNTTKFLHSWQKDLETDRCEIELDQIDDLFYTSKERGRMGLIKTLVAVDMLELDTPAPSYTAVVAGAPVAPAPEPEAATPAPALDPWYSADLLSGETWSRLYTFSKSIVGL